MLWIGHFLSKNGIVDSAMCIAVSVNACVCVDADSYRGLGSDSVLIHTLRSAVFLLAVIKKEKAYCHVLELCQLPPVADWEFVKKLPF